MNHLLLTHTYTLPHHSPPLQAQHSCFNFRVRKLFETLKIEPFLLKINVVVAYRKLTCKYHPDIWNGEKVDYKYDTSVEKFKTIANAYQGLCENIYCHKILLNCK